MKLIRLFASILFSLTYTNVTFGLQITDTTFNRTKIRAIEKEFKSKKCRLLRKIKFHSVDSTEIYGVDKSGKEITTIQIIRHPNSTQRDVINYWFLNNQLFKISIITDEKVKIGIWHKKSNWLYLFSNDTLYFKEQGDNISQQAISFLLSQSKLYFLKAETLLKEEISPQKKNTSRY